MTAQQLGACWRARHTDWNIAQAPPAVSRYGQGGLHSHLNAAEGEACMAALACSTLSRSQASTCAEGQPGTCRAPAAQEHQAGVPSSRPPFIPPLIGTHSLAGHCTHIPCHRSAGSSSARPPPWRHTSRPAGPPAPAAAPAGAPMARPPCCGKWASQPGAVKINLEGTLADGTAVHRHAQSCRAHPTSAAAGG